VAASAIPGRVPLGFVCGHPVGVGGELYGGSMFIKSAANDTFQGKAIQSTNQKWGEQKRTWNGRETIGIQVCKKKYTPFLFNVETVEDDEIDADSGNSVAARDTIATAENGRRRKKVVKVIRMYGCPHHSNLRKEKIECYGVRSGWEPFGQWSLRKAQQMARRETIRLNSKSDCKRDDDCITSIGDTKQGARSFRTDTEINNLENEQIKTICHNGKCTWKMKDKYDNVYNEIKGYDSFSEEDT